jgi:hypothetical protein
MVPTRATILAALRIPIPLSFGGFDGGFDVGGGFGDTTIECTDLGDEVGGQAAQRLERGLAGPDLAQDVRGAVRRQTTRCSWGCEVGQQDMQPVDGLGAGFDQVLAVFHHGAQGGDGSVHRGCVESGGGQCGDTDRDGVSFVGLAAVPGGEHSNSGGEFGGHVGHVDSVGV